MADNLVYTPKGAIATLARLSAAGKLDKRLFMKAVGLISKAASAGLGIKRADLTQLGVPIPGTQPASSTTQEPPRAIGPQPTPPSAAPPTASAGPVSVTPLGRRVRNPAAGPVPLVSATPQGNGPFANVLRRLQSPRSGTASARPAELRERANRIRARRTTRAGY